MSTQDALADIIFAERGYPPIVAAEAALALLAERGMVVLGPDGEPLDVRPALRALGLWALGGSQSEKIDALVRWRRIPALLAQACIATEAGG